MQYRTITLLAKLAFIVAIPLSAQSSSRNEHWVATWSAPVWLAQIPQPNFAPPRVQAGTPPATPPSAPPRFRPVGPILNNVSNQTIRMVGRLSMGGSTFRLRLTNSFGARPVTINAVHAALRTKDASIDLSSDRTVTFGGKPSVTIACASTVAVVVPSPAISLVLVAASLSS